jgi:hypothetical protein
MSGICTVVEVSRSFDLPPSENEGRLDGRLLQCNSPADW